MHSPVIVVASLLLALYAAGLLVTLVAIFHAPSGFEDNEGFHLADEANQPSHPRDGAFRGTPTLHVG